MNQQALDKLTLTNIFIPEKYKETFTIIWTLFQGHATFKSQELE